MYTGLGASLQVLTVAEFVAEVLGSSSGFRGALGRTALGSVYLALNSIAIAAHFRMHRNRIRHLYPPQIAVIAADIAMIIAMM